MDNFMRTKMDEYLEKDCFKNMYCLIDTYSKLEIIDEEMVVKFIKHFESKIKDKKELIEKSPTRKELIEKSPAREELIEKSPARKELIEKSPARNDRKKSDIY
jgi:hypothetical protein